MGGEPRTVVQQYVTVQSGFGYGAIGADIHVLGNGTPLYLLERHAARPDAHDRAWLRELPSRMLNARAEVVPFTGREDELHRLRDWLQTGPRLAVRWLHAPGGQGKTRLAHHAATEAEADGWKAVHAIAGVGAVDPSPGSQDLRLDGHRGVLLIVDYADRWSVESLTWLLRNALLHRDDVPARVLLLARTTASWPALRGALEDPDSAIGMSEQLLPPVDTTDPLARATMFEAARDSFAAIYDLPDPAAIAPWVDLADPALGLILTLHVAALVAVDAFATGDQAPSDPDQLTRYLLERECRQWQTRFEARVRGLDHETPPDLMNRTVFTAALTGPMPHRDASALLAAMEPGLNPEPVLTDHARCYPPPDPAAPAVLQPLYPDRLAEDFLALTLCGAGSERPAEPWAPTRLDRLLAADESPGPQRWWQRRRPAASPPAPYLARAVTFLTAAAARWPALGPAHLFPLLLARPSLAVMAGSATLTTLAEIPAVDIALLEAIEGLLPDERRIDLDVSAAAISARLTPHRLAQTSKPAERARLHARHCELLTNVGRWDEALPHAQEATALHGRLVAGRLNRRPDFAASLETLSTCYWETGRRGAAHAMLTEAIGLRRDLAKTNPDRQLPALGAALIRNSCRLLERGRADAALADAEEAMDVYRRLAKAHRGHLPGLLLSLQNLVTCLTALGRRREALLATEVVVTIGRRLAEADPATYLPDLAAALTDRMVQLVEHGDRQGAAALLTLTGETIDRYRASAQTDPVEHLPRLAECLGHLATTLWRLAEHRTAVTRAEEAVQLHRELSQVNPAAFLPELGHSLDTLAQCLSTLNRRTEAHAAAQEATQIQRRLARVNPATHLPDLARSLHRLGERLRGLQRDDEARTAIDETVGLYRQLAETDPTAYLPWLAQVLRELGTCLSDQGLHDGVAAAQEAVHIGERLTRANPGAYASSLAISLDVLTRCLSNLNRWAEALPAAEAAVRLRRRQTQDAVAPHRHAMAMSLSTLSGILDKLGRHDEALPPAREAVELLRPLAAADPATFHADLALSLTVLSTNLGAIGRRGEAIAPARAVDLYRQLAAADFDRYGADLGMAAAMLDTVTNDAGKAS